MNAMQKIIDYFNDNNDKFTECIEELDDCNGCLGDDRYYEMDELGELYTGDVVEVLTRAYYGYDGDCLHDYDKKEPFCPNRNYFYFNGYGNLVSTDSKDYSDYIDNEYIELMLEHRNDIYSIREDNELGALFDELEKEENGND